MEYNGYLLFIHGHEQRLIEFYNAEMEVFDTQIKALQAEIAPIAQEQMQILLSQDLHPTEQMSWYTFDENRKKIASLEAQVEKLADYLNHMISRKRKVEGRDGFAR